MERLAELETLFMEMSSEKKQALIEFMLAARQTEQSGSAVQPNNERDDRYCGGDGHHRPASLLAAGEAVIDAQ